MFELFDKFFSLTASELVHYIPSTVHPMNYTSHKLASEIEELSCRINELSSNVNYETRFAFPISCATYCSRATRIRHYIDIHINAAFKAGISSIANRVKNISNALQHIDDLLSSSKGSLSEEKFNTMCEYNQTINEEWRELMNHNLLSCNTSLCGYNVIESVLSETDYTRYRIQCLSKTFSESYELLFGKGIEILGVGQKEKFVPFTNAEYCNYTLSVDALLVLFNNWYYEQHGNIHPAYAWLVDMNNVHRYLSIKHILIGNKNPYNTFVDSLLIYLNVADCTPFINSIIQKNTVGTSLWNSVRNGTLKLRYIDNGIYSFI